MRRTPDGFRYALISALELTDPSETVVVRVAKEPEWLEYEQFQKILAARAAGANDGT
jgi:hypothetical protein